MPVSLEGGLGAAIHRVAKGRTYLETEQPNTKACPLVVTALAPAPGSSFPRPCPGLSCVRRKRSEVAAAEQWAESTSFVIVGVQVSDLPKGEACLELLI